MGMVRGCAAKRSLDANRRSRASEVMSDKLTLILLAAGRSVRMRGADKMLEDVGGTPLLNVMARRCAKVGPTIVVLGPDQDARLEALTDVECDVKFAQQDTGMSSSIVTGLGGLDAPAAMIVLADMPEVTAHDMYVLATLAAQAPKMIFRAAAADGTPGHPVIFPAHLFGELSEITGDQGARDVLKRHSNLIHLVPLPENRALTDLDTPEAWAAWRAERTIS
jgi:molybdenum cofactor cytidylyltransferase